MLTRHDDIKRELQPKIEVLSQYHESVSNEALQLNEQAVDNLRMLRSFTQKCQDGLLQAGNKINGLFRKVGSFTA